MLYVIVVEEKVALTLIVVVTGRRSMKCGWIYRKRPILGCNEVQIISTLSLS